MSMRKIMEKIFVGTLKWKVFLKRKVFGEILVEYLGSISRKNSRGSLGKYL
jgi:predicted metal-dependent peptidase